jgi:formiminotetrahydrofolate cyclodeaminase
MEIIHEAKENFGKEKIKADKSASKSEKKQIKETNLAIERASIIMQDINKFSGEAGIARLTQARADYANGVLYLYENADEEMKTAKSLPKSTETEKEIRSDAIKNARIKKESASLIRRYGSENIVKPDESVKEEFQNSETNGFAESMNVRRELKAYLKAVSIYERAVKPYTNAKNLIEQAENYTHYEELEERYSAMVR